MIGSDETGPGGRSGRASSGESAMSDLVAVGRVRRPTGIDGSLLVEVYTGNSDRFSTGDTLFIAGVEHEIVGTGKSGKSAKIRLAGVDSIEAADPFRDEEIAVSPDSLPENPPGTYYHYEILGLDVVTVDGVRLGVLSEILETGSNDVFVVSARRGPASREVTEAGRRKRAGSSAEVLIPVLEGVIVNVDREAGFMTIDPPDGLF